MCLNSNQRVISIGEPDISRVSSRHPEKPEDIERKKKEREQKKSAEKVVKETPPPRPAEPPKAVSYFHHLISLNFAFSKP